MQLAGWNLKNYQENALKGAFLALAKEKPPTTRFTKDPF
jgi:hypothetical protein